MATTRTILTRVGGINGDLLSTGPCCLVGQTRRKEGPCRVGNRLGKAMIVDHAIDGQVFYSDDIIAIDYTATFLMNKVTTPVSDTLMHSRYDPTPLSASRCPFRCL